MRYIHSYSSLFRFLLFHLIISAFLLCSIMLNHSHAQITLDGSMGTSGPLAGPDFNITSDLGQVRGSNLFHSFGEFNIQTGESATFSGSNAIANILSRVTGVNQSFIDGTLASTIPGANLYLLNPNGVLFGANARLNVQGSFHVSTADYLRFGDGAEFHADLSKGSNLTVAPVAAFGFLGDNPAAVTINQSSLEVPEDETLSVIGGDIEVSGAFLGAESGRINIASVASPGEVVPNVPGEASDLQVDSFSSLGNIDLSQGAYLDAGGDGGGTVIIRGGCFMMDNSYVYASTKGPAVGSLVGEPGAGIDIQVDNDVVLDNGSEIGTNVFQDVAPGIGSGGIRVKANSLEVANFSALQSIVFWQSTGGKGGDIDVNTNSVLVRDQGSIHISTGGAGDSGDLNVKTKNLEVRDGGEIFTTAFAGIGHAGDINLDTDSILLSDDKPGGWTTMITTQTWGGTGNAGNVNISSGSLQILGRDYAGKGISTITWGDGQGGDVNLEIDGDITISGSIGNVNTGISANTWGSGDSGLLNISANNLKATTGSIQSIPFGTGNGGDARIMLSGSLELLNGGAIITEWLYDPFSQFSQGGRGGNVDIIANSVLISGFESLPYLNTGTFPIETGIFARGKNFGRSGGDVRFFVDDSMVLAQGGLIDVSSLGSGQGGNIDLYVGDGGILKVLDGSKILSNTYSSGNSGNINVFADSVLISGEDSVFKEYYISNGFDPKFARSSIMASSKLGFQQNALYGKAGQISIEAENFQVQNEGLIYTGTDTSGDAGKIDILADNVTFSNNALLSAESLAFGNAGNAGSISITVRNMFESDHSSITSTTNDANGGEISITSGRDVMLRNRSLISVKSLGKGNSGNININAGNMFKSENSSVTTEAEKASGGNINVTSGYLTYLVNSEITSSVGGDSDTVGGNITMNQPYGVLDNSKILANADEGKGGNIKITADVFIADPNSVVSASSAKGVDGEVDIRATVKNISASIGPLKEDYSSAQSLLLEPCAVRMSDGKKSSLIVAGRDGLPARPGDLLPSPLYDAEMAKADSEIAGILDIPPLAYGVNFFEDQGLLPLDMMEGDTGCTTCP